MILSKKYLKRLSLHFLIAVTFAYLLSLTPLFSQSLTLDMGGGAGAATGGTFTSRAVQFVILITILSLAPSILMMVTSFTRIVIVFSFLRSAIGLQQSPPNSILIGLALFLTGFIMAPTFEKAYQDGLKPYMENQLQDAEAFDKMGKPFHEFMRKHVREKDVGLFVSFAKLENFKNPEEIPFKILVPAFMLSELKRAFEIGFLLFLPFIIIDMVVASVLMSMGMMMLPPMMISLPFKLIFFVMIDGWHLLVGSLVRGFGT